MFDDPKKELDALQEKLLREEDWFEKELDSAKRMIGQQPEKDRIAAAAAAEKKEKAPEAVPARNFANGVSRDDTQIWTRELNFEEEAPPAKDKGIKKLLIIAAVETLGILALGGYWLLYLLG